MYVPAKSPIAAYHAALNKFVLFWQRTCVANNVPFERAFPGGRSAFCLVRDRDDLQGQFLTYCAGDAASAFLVAARTRGFSVVQCDGVAPSHLDKARARA